MLKLGIYRHYKNKEYQVIGEATHSETLEDVVVYRALYGERGLLVRPLKMFTETVVAMPKLEKLNRIASIVQLFLSIFYVGFLQ